MKKIFSAYLVALLSCVLLFSCKNTEDTGKLYLIEQTMTDKTGTITVKHYYDKNYRIVKQDTLSGDESDSESELGYDESGHWIYQKSTSKAGLVTEVHIINDEKGRPIEQSFAQTYNNNTTTFTWMFEYTDENGSYIQTNSNGTVIMVTMDSHGNEIARSTNKGQSSTVENTYNGDNLTEAKTTMTIGTKTTITTMRYEYDDQGNKIKETNYDSDGNVIGAQIFKYARKVQFVD
ncbi:MAG: hypothetical protein J6D15_06275 [Clostridia bacterium]|nr:hypothetical protein [Clostridia bacterium]MBO5316447.1 hypothetical protein [Clostridia bacterium]